MGEMKFPFRASPKIQNREGGGVFTDSLRKSNGDPRGRHVTKAEGGGRTETKLVVKGSDREIENRQSDQSSLARLQERWSKGGKTSGKTRMGGSKQ